jgi:hypothetical protein
MAIDFPASPTLNDVFTVGNVTYVWDGTKWTASVTGGISLDKIEEGNTSAEVIDTGSDGRFVVTTEGTGRLFVRTLKFTTGSNTGTFASEGHFQFSHGTNGDLVRIDSSGRVGIGTTSPSGANLVIDTESSGGTGIRLIGRSANDGSKIDFYADNNSTRLGYIECNSTSTTFYSETNVPVRFFQNGGEAFRVDTSKRLLVGTSSWSANATLVAQGNSGGSTSRGVIYLALGANNPADGTALGHLEFSDSGGGRAAQINVLHYCGWGEFSDGADED